MSNRLHVGFAFAIILAIQLSAFGEGTWPGFRGRGDSLVEGAKLPVAWKEGKRQGWTVDLPGYGQSSPAIWGDRVFVTAVSGKMKEHLHLLAFNLADGALEWRRDFAGTQKVLDSDTVSRGAPTPVVDAESVYAMFESGDLFALTHQGDPVWERSIVSDFGEFQGNHGYGSSPVLIDDALILQVCHGGPSYVVALDAADGKTRWKTDHPQQTGWSTPVAYERQGAAGVIVNSSGSVRAYDVKSGDELWFITEVQGNATPSPTVAGDLVLIGGSEPRGGGRGRGGRGGPPRQRGEAKEKEQEQEQADDFGPPRGSLAIRLGGEGDVSDSHVAWRAQRVMSGFASPLAYNGLGFFVNRVGVAQCVDLETGELKWQHRLPGSVWASPVGNDGRVFFFARDGQMAVIEASAELKPVAESKLPVNDGVYGIAAVDGVWIVRTGRQLIKIEAPGS